MKNNKKKITLVALLTMMSVFCLGTYAYLRSEDSVANNFTVGDVNIDISEDFTPPNNWDGEEYEKVVQIKNNSKVDALIRVAIVPRWVDENNKPWAGDTSIVSLNYNNDNIADSSSTEINKWVKGKDNYFYYNTIVPKGQKTVEILKSVSANIPTELKDRYKGKKLIVDVKAEAVQSTIEAYKATWSNLSEDEDIQSMLNRLCSK